MSAVQVDFVTTVTVFLQWTQDYCSAQRSSGWGRVAFAVPHNIRSALNKQVSNDKKQTCAWGASCELDLISSTVCWRVFNAVSNSNSSFDGFPVLQLIHPFNSNVITLRDLQTFSCTISWRVRQRCSQALVQKEITTAVSCYLYTFVADGRTILDLDCSRDRCCSVMEMQRWTPSLGHTDLQLLLVWSTVVAPIVSTASVLAELGACDTCTAAKNN